MSDADLRTLERAVAATPTDAVLAERLAQARVRAGFGWHGEKLPDALRPAQERNVYELRLHPKGGEAIALQLVYVAGGEVDCFYDQPGHDKCGSCWKTPGRAMLTPFYVGRFPVMWNEWAAWWRVEESRDGARRRELPLAPDPSGVNAYLPAVNMTHADALAFCGFVGLRLPTPHEWAWAALGRPDEAPCVRCRGRGEVRGGRGELGDGEREPLTCPVCNGRKVGNVYQWSAQGDLLGTCFRWSPGATPVGHEHASFGGGSETIGFRVALSAP